MDPAALRAASVARPPMPQGTALRADATVAWAAPTVLTGGAPWRLFSLTEEGASTVARWCDGAPVGPGATERALARRLVDAGLLHPVRDPRPARDGEVAIVVPVRDDAPGLDALLGSLGSLGAAAPGVLVVDDGSADPGSIADVASRHTARVVRRAETGGPAAARNAGLAATTEPLIAFLDADVVAPPSWLEALLPHFDDPSVAAVAPRVIGPSGTTARDRFEAVASPLDLGGREAFVQPGSAVAYVPAAALVVRRDAVATGFDESLLVGEDVDFIWRLVEEGWLVRYEPASTVTHAARATWRAWLAQRFSYGRSAAALEARHGEAAAPLRGDPRMLATLALAIAGRPRAALGVLGWSASSMARQLAGLEVTSGSDRLARQLVTRGTVLAAPGIARAAFRSYGPLLVAAAVAVNPLRRPVTVLAASATAIRWWRAGRPRPAVEFAALSLADDLAYGAGVVAGAVAARRPGALVPRLRRAQRRPSVSRT